MRCLALLTILVVLIIGAALLMAAPGTALRRQGGRARARGKEGYLVYPYLDLDEPGERGSYYALAECA